MRATFLAIALVAAAAFTAGADDLTTPVSIEIISTPKDQKSTAVKVSIPVVLYGYAMLPLRVDRNNWRVCVDVETNTENQPPDYVEVTIENLDLTVAGGENAQGSPVEILSASFPYTPGKPVQILEMPEATLSLTITPK